MGQKRLWTEATQSIRLKRIRQAVAAALANPNLRTADLGERLTTQEMTGAILGFL